MLSSKKGFTLVEIIIVVSIIIILAAIATISLRKQLKNSQDVSRITSINTIGNWLKEYFSKYGSYPIPDNNKLINYGNIFLWYQWKVGNNVSQNINLQNIPTDPAKNTLFSYTTNYDNTKFQLLAFLENEKSYTFENNTIYRKYYSLGDKVGFIFVNENSDLPSDIDLSWNTNLYTAIFSNITYLSSISGEDIWIWKILLDPNLHDKLANIVLSFNFEKWNSSKVFDLSQYRNNWSLSGTILPQYIGGKKWYWLRFLWNWYIQVNDDDSLDLTNFTISFWINISKTPSTEISLIEKWWNYKLTLATDNKIKCIVWTTTVQTYASLKIWNWYHITCKFDGSNVSLLLNNVPQKTDTATASTNISNLIIWNWFDWILDEILILNKSISNNLVKLLYEN